MSIDLSQGGRPLSKEEKCSLYSISSEEYFKCLKNSNVQLFSPSQSLPTGALIGIIVVIFIVLLALDVKYEVHFFSSIWGFFVGLFTGGSVNRVSRRRR